MPGPFDIVPDPRRYLRYEERGVTFSLQHRPEFNYVWILGARCEVGGRTYAVRYLAIMDNLDYYSEGIDGWKAHAHEQHRLLRAKTS